MVTLTTVGMTVLEGELSIQFMPNPTTGQLTMEVGQLVNDAILEVFDNSGRRVFRQESLTIGQQIQLDLSGLADGVYQVRLSTDSAVATQRVVVRH